MYFDFIGCQLQAGGGQQGMLGELLGVIRGGTPAQDQPSVPDVQPKLVDAAMQLTAHPLLKTTYFLAVFASNFVGKGQ
jgi:hypothetical protein